MNSSKIGGIAGIIEALLYIIGFTFLALVFAPMMDEGTPALERLSFALEHKTRYQVWNLLIYVVFGLVLIPLTIAINQQFKSDSLLGSKATPVLGFIWSVLVIASGMITNVGLETVNTLFQEDQAQALLVWKTLSAIANGLGGGVEVVGGVWVLLISIFGLKQSVFPKGLNYLGLLVGAAGTLTLIPGLQDLGAIFGLTQIVWFAWIGIYLFRKA